MPFLIPIAQAQTDFPQYTFIKALAPSEQKAAFHVQDQNGDDLCLKIIAPTYSLDRLQREIEALQQLDNPSIAKLREYTFSSTPSLQKHYLIEDFIDGQDLSEVFAAGLPWTRHRVASFFKQIAEALVACCDARIVHRDLKPSNIRVRPTQEVVIIDFGLARHLDKPDLTYTVDGAGIGTPLYFAPEQFVGTKRDIDHRTDLFAVGILMYQALTGKHPFFDNLRPITRHELSNLFCNSTDFLREPEFVALPPQWQILVNKLLEKEKGKRIQHPLLLIKILDKIGAI